MAITLLQPFNFDSSKDYTFANVTVTANIQSGNANLGNAATANYFIGNGAYLTGLPASYANSNVAAYLPTFTGELKAGNANLGNTVTANYFTGTLTTAAQPNITSIGSLTGLTVSNTTGIVNFATTANVTLGAVSNLHISGGTSGYVLQTDGTGNLSWTAQTGGGGGGSPGGANTQLQFNDEGAFGGSAALTFNKTSNTLTVTNANITSNISVGSGTGGNITGANIISANYFIGAGNALSNITAANITGTVANANYAAYAAEVTDASQPNITSVGTLSSLAVTANITSGNASLGNVASANIMNLGTAARPANVQGNCALFVVSNTASSSPPISIQNRFATGYSSIDIFNSSDIFMGAFGAVNPSASTVPALANMVYMYSAASTAGIGLYSSNGNVSFSANANANIFVVTGTGANVSGTFNVTGNLITANANLGNLVTANYHSGNGSLLTAITGANVTGTVANATYAISAGSTTTAGTVTTAAQPNITSVGTLTSVSVTGNANVGNLGTSGLIVATGNITGGNIATAGELKSTGTFLIGTQTFYPQGSDGFSVNENFNAGNSTVTAYHFASGAGRDAAVFDIAVTGEFTTGFGATGTDAVNKFVQFSENANTTWEWRKSVGISAPDLTGGTLLANINPSGNLYTLGTITGTGNVTGANLITAGLVSGVDAIFTGNLTVQGNTTYVNVETFRVEDPVIELGGGANGAPLTTNDGKDRGTLLHYYTTTTVDAFMGWDNSNAEFAFGSNVSVSSDVVTFNTLGNVRAGYFLGNGSQLTGTVANANYAAYAAEVTDASQPNITSLGTLTGLNSNGTVNFSNSTNVTLGSVSTLHISGGTDGYVLQTDGTGNLTWTAQTGGGGGSVAGANTEVQYNNAGAFGGSAAFTFNNVSNTLTSANITATANLSAANANLGNAVTANYFIGTFYGTANSAGNATTAGTVTTAAQPNITSTGTLTSLTVSGLLTATGTGVKTSNIVDSTGTTAIITRYGSVTGAVGIYSDLTVGTSGTGNLTVSGNSNLGSNSNVYISGGSADYVLSTDGAGNLSWVAQTGGGGGGGSSIANGTSNVNIATSGGNITMTVAGTANVLTVTNTGIVLSGNAALGSNSNVLITGGASGQVLATNGDGTLYWTTAGSAVVYQLDDLSNYTDGVINTFMLAYNQTIVPISDPFGILVTINGAVQPAFVWNTDVVWQSFTLPAYKGYTIIDAGYLTFTDPPPAGAEIMVRTVTGITNTDIRRYPFIAGDIMLG